MQKALITGITGQDGAYLAAHLLSNGYKVYGAHRRAASNNFWRIKELGIINHPNLKLVEHDLTDPASSLRVLENSEVDEVYNLAAQSFVGVSFAQPYTTSQITGIGVLNLLEAIRCVNPQIKFYQASSSEMFGKVQSCPQNENTAFYPRSPYGVAKLYAHWMTINYRESYGIFACSGILFNHESPLRGLEFVTRKITHSIAKIKLGQLDILKLGNLDAKRDWGYAKDYVIGMHAMLQAADPDNYVLATGKTYTVRDFVSMTCEIANIPIEWQGEGQQELAINLETKQPIIVIDPAFYRPAEVDILIGDSSHAKRSLNWQANTTLYDLCRMMYEADLKRNS